MHNVSNKSFKVDPEAIERVTNSSFEQVYTVVDRSIGGEFKPATPNKRAPKSGQGTDANDADEHGIPDECSLPSPEPLPPMCQTSSLDPQPPLPSP